jgi:hypothetical protein
MRTDMKSGEMTSTNIIHQLVPSAKEDHLNINLKLQHGLGGHTTSDGLRFTQIQLEYQHYHEPLFKGTAQ